jgi:hypothetical protein
MRSVGMSYDWTTAENDDEMGAVTDRFLRRFHVPYRSSTVLTSSLGSGAALVGLKTASGRRNLKFSLWEIENTATSQQKLFETNKNYYDCDQVDQPHKIESSFSEKQSANNMREQTCPVPDNLVRKRTLLPTTLPEVMEYWSSNNATVLLGDILITGTAQLLAA